MTIDYNNLKASIENLSESTLYAAIETLTSVIVELKTNAPIILQERVLDDLNKFQQQHFAKELQSHKLALTGLTEETIPSSVPKDFKDIQLLKLDLIANLEVAKNLNAAHICSIEQLLIQCQTLLGTLVINSQLVKEIAGLEQEVIKTQDLLQVKLYSSEANRAEATEVNIAIVRLESEIGLIEREQSQMHNLRRLDQKNLDLKLQSARELLALTQEKSKELLDLYDQLYGSITQDTFKFAGLKATLDSKKKDLIDQQEPMTIARDSVLKHLEHVKEHDAKLSSQFGVLKLSANNALKKMHELNPGLAGALVQLCLSASSMLWGMVPSFHSDQSGPAVNNPTEIESPVILVDELDERLFVRSPITLAGPISTVATKDERSPRPRLSEKGSNDSCSSLPQLMPATSPSHGVDQTSLLAEYIPPGPDSPSAGYNYSCRP